MQVLIHTFGPLLNLCLNIHVIWNAFASWYTIYILCTSVKCPYVKLLLLHLYGNGGVSVLNWNETEKKKKKIQLVSFLSVCCN